MSKPQRDSKGRFVKGIAPEGSSPFSAGVAKEMQLRSAEARKRNRALADVIRAELTKAAPGTDLTKMEYLAAKAISNHAQGEMTFKDLRDLQHLLGEDKQILNLEGDGIRIVVENAEQAAKLGEIEKLG